MGSNSLAGGTRKPQATPVATTAPHMTNLARLASAKAFAGGSTPTAMPQLAKAASPATPVANGGEGPARLYDLQQMVNTYRKETRETHKWRTEVDKEHREATEQLADTALERYTSNNAMLAELFDGRPYQPPPEAPREEGRVYRQARRLYHRTAGVDGEQGAAAERAAEADEAAADTPTFKVVSAEEHTRRVDKRKQATAAYDQLKLRVDSTMRCVDEGICLRAYQSAVGFPCQVPKLPRHPKWASHERPLAGDRTPPQPPTWGPLQMARMISGSGFREVNVAFELGDQPFDPAAFLRGLVVARL